MVPDTYLLLFPLFTSLFTVLNHIFFLFLIAATHEAPFGLKSFFLPLGLCFPKCLHGFWVSSECFTTRVAKKGCPEEVSLRSEWPRQTKWKQQPPAPVAPCVTLLHVSLGSYCVSLRSLSPLWNAVLEGRGTLTTKCKWVSCLWPAHRLYWIAGMYQVSYSGSDCVHSWRWECHFWVGFPIEDVLRNLLS